MFEPCFSTKLAGRGMGLAVVKGIVRDHAGTIETSSVPSQGTTFRVLLPCSVERTVENHSAIPVRGLAPAKARIGTILVVEDIQLLREAISKVLRGIVFLGVQAVDGFDPIELIH